MSEHTFDEIEIREAAYYIWLNEGQPAGSDQQHWARAVETLKASAPQAKPAKKQAKTTRKAVAKAAPKAKAAAKKPATKRATKTAKA